MPLKFGTSGVRGLVTEMTDAACYRYTRAFAEYLKDKSLSETVSLAGDYRSSTPRIMRAVAHAITDSGLSVDNCGMVPTPAVAYQGLRHERASIMVTGSHIPDDRNGIKFNMPWGEVLKADEAEISKRCGALEDVDPGSSPELPEVSGEARASYVERYRAFFPAGCLDGLTVVVYQHSSVLRDILPEIIGGLGAEVVPVGWSDAFVAVDTEAVEDPERLAAWVQEHGADALASADGDGDRPLVVDEAGKVIRGDVLGILVADFLGADAVSTPVSCNTALERSGRFPRTQRTRIGSPYVIAAMTEAVEHGGRTVVGYEANGGFLTATDITHPDTGTVLGALPTRDAVLPILSALIAGKREKSLSSLAADLPSRYTASGLLRGFPNDRGKALVAEFQGGGKDVAGKYFKDIFGTVESLDFTDGARITFQGGDVVHLRPSGNAPEFRCYTESETEETAVRNNGKALEIVERLR
ncbi:phosphomannomutase [Planctomycetota bacterium]